MKIDVKEIKTPDVLVTAGGEAMHWTEKHMKTVVFGFIGAVAVGLIWVFVSNIQKKAELTAHEDLFAVEKTYSLKKENLAKETEAKKSAETSKKKSEQAQENLKASVGTGDIEKDFGTEIQGYKGVIEKHSELKAGGLAALGLIQIYSEYDKASEVLPIVEPVLAKQKNGLVKVMLSQAIGTVQANKGDCASAIKTWSFLLNDKSASFVKHEAQLKTALCEHTLGNKDKAKSLLEEIQKQDDANGKSAKKYLRAMALEAN